MDSLKVCPNIVVMAATDCPDLINPALCRFYCEVINGIPDLKGHLENFLIYTKSICLMDDVHLKQVRY